MYGQIRANWILKKVEEKKKLDHNSVKFKIRNQSRKSMKIKAGWLIKMVNKINKSLGRLRNKERKHKLLILKIKGRIPIQCISCKE